MKSAVAVTYELDDAPEAARQLADAISGQLKFAKNSIGILFCDADMDCATVSGELKKLLGIEIAGMTTLATLSRDGYHHSAAVLKVMTADDCVFGTSVSQSLSDGDYAQKIIDAYRESIPAGSSPDYKPGLLFALCPSGIPFSADKYPEILSKEIGNAPIIGGIASDNYEYVSARVFLSGQEYRDAIVIVNISGNVKPLFSIRHTTSRFAERIRQVTDATDNIVRKVGDETFVEYLKGFGLETNVPDVLLAFNPYPMMLTREGGDNEVPLMRHITGLDLETGSGSCVGDVPVGTMANICLLNKNDLITSCRESIDALLEMADKQKDYEYSTIFCISCCGRALLLGADSNAEGDVLAERVPEGLTLTGAYCFGELCPSHYENGKATNKFHNCSITFCML